MRTAEQDICAQCKGSTFPFKVKGLKHTIYVHVEWPMSTKKCVGSNLMFHQTQPKRLIKLDAGSHIFSNQMH